MIKTKHQSVSLTLAHINDTHSYFEPTSLQLQITVDQQVVSPYVSAGGFARIATRAEQLREQAQLQQRGFLFLHAGDCFQGTLYFSLFKGKANADMLNALKLDAMALGNHELDMGNEPVAHFLKRIEFPLLAGNWDVSNENPNKPFKVSDSDRLHSYVAAKKHAAWIEKEINGERIAIFSLALDKMADISTPDADTPFINSIEVAKATVAAIHHQGINNIILLSHLGYESDLELAAKVDGIGIVVGGHSHRLQGDFSTLGLTKDDDYGQKINDTYVVQAGFHAQTIGHCDITFDAYGRVSEFNGKNELLLGRRLCLDATLSQTHTDDAHEKACQYLRQHPHVVICKKNPYVHSILVDKYMPKVKALQQTIIGRTDYKLRHVRVPDENGSSEVAPLVAESFAFALNQKGHDIEFAIHNAGGVRTSLDPGDITIADIAGKLLPFAVPIGCYEIQGRYISQLLEGAINNALSNGVVGTGSGSYPYTHNLRFEYCSDKPLGLRIVKLEIYTFDINGQQKTWQKVEATRYFKGTSSAYTMKGKEGYDAIVNMRQQGQVTSLSMADCFIEFLKYHPDRFQQMSLNPADMVGISTTTKAVK
ncbi:bifunctional metallophosphatase/5'-nucleotidase [Vibrio sp. S17_S38]|uniref:bifunctional metallophosphatase/5'-nucleotidase n=1 Tax=Vibrio sp. S17_S38 TaxID=2720229 RepID=UPI001681532E|nr:5'-nucleotidase C-terminal domain-containing protein [Vibrio sp. S17_S38]MBD1573518.1 bifunctional metallophosphatase/5'-nucleotidase [Vibrio sp. S17_S38]